MSVYIDEYHYKVLHIHRSLPTDALYDNPEVQPVSVPGDDALYELPQLQVTR